MKKKIMSVFVATMFAAAVFPLKHTDAARTSPRTTVVVAQAGPVKPDRYIPGRLMVKLSTAVQRDAEGFAVQSLQIEREQVLEIFRADFELTASPRKLFDTNQNDAWYVMEVPGGQEDSYVAMLQADKRVLGVQYDQRVELCQEPQSFSPNDPLYVNFPFQWNLKRINMPQFWGFAATLQITGEPVRIAVIDSGLDYNHEDLVGKTWVNQAEANGIPGVDDDHDGIIDDIHGARFVNGVVSGEPFDTGSHGTSVSGIADAATNNGIGVASVAGLSNVQVVPVCVIAPGATTANFSDILMGFHYVAVIAQTANIRAMNVSLGLENSGGSALDDAMASLHSQGVLVSFAAGNHNDDVSNYGGVIAFPNVVVATGTDETDHVVFNYAVLALAAPGRNLGTTSPGNQYSGVSGTSASAPEVSAAAALLGVYRPALNNPRLVKDQLFATSGMQGQIIGPTGTQGAFGLLDVNAALQSHPTLDPVDSVEIGKAVYDPGSGQLVVRPFSTAQDPVYRLFGGNFARVKVKANGKIIATVLGAAPNEVTVIDMKYGGFATVRVKQ